METIYQRQKYTNTVPKKKRRGNALLHTKISIPRNDEWNLGSVGLSWNGLTCKSHTLLAYRLKTLLNISLKEL